MHQITMSVLFLTDNYTSQKPKTVNLLPLNYTERVLWMQTMTFRYTVIITLTHMKV